ncbi:MULTISPECIES: toxic anion resistance protein [Sutcliffiella]|uniref:Toxic anion resistance protein n=1 Tax=Sutcliffiella cohnii TaxID=33932 RepID=A0A223KQV4_9BACI|nr:MULTISPECIES: toxic anion resistance protein [Sutcliffiella]AST91816.1 toxic anion resistance protein [Sutcliffiella cohnii]WBL13034.1 toxic anion resistance protein [Sutcliffiella sp. NC1]
MDKEKIVEQKLKDDTLNDLLNNPFSTTNSGEIIEVEQQLEQKESAMNSLSEEHKKKAIEIAKQINPEDQQAISQYGVAAQSELSNFSNSILSHIQTKDAGPVGEVITDLMTKIKEVKPGELEPKKKGMLSRLFGGIGNSVNQLFAKYRKIGFEIDKISDQLESFKKVLQRDNIVLESLYDKNKEYFQALNVYIAAGEHKLEELQTKTIPEMEQKARLTNNQMEAQAVSDMLQFVDRLEKRVHDLKISRQITLQMAPQIRLIQHTNQTLVERIHSSILTAIPLWKNQLIIAVSLYNQQKAVDTQKSVTETTNDLLLRNSEMLKQNTIAAARENERGIVDVETLKKTQANLIETLEETLKIQQEGREKRVQVEQELVSMENELKQKLLNATRKLK